MPQVPAINPVFIAPFAGDANGGAEIDPTTRHGVERLIHTYSYNWDSRDATGTASLFTDDAEVAFFVNGAAKATDRTIGRDRLTETMTARTAMLQRWSVETRHLMLNTVFDDDRGDGIEAVTTAVVFWQQLPDRPAPVAVQTGYYRSWCVNTAVGWRFTRRESHMSGLFHPRQLYEKPGR